MEQKKYMDIVRLGHKVTFGVLNEGDDIIIQEKLDGANASFRRDGDIIRVYSRNNELSEENTLRGFYTWVQTNIDVASLEEDEVYIGEWLVKHKIDYGENLKKFFLYDVYITSTHEYAHYSLVDAVASSLGIPVAPRFYVGKYQSFEHLQSFVGRTDLGGKLGEIETGEGVVVKNYDYKDRYGRQVFVKLVTDAFREIQSQKAPKNPNRPQTVESEFVSTYLTEARVEKMIHKLVDEGILDEAFGIEDIGTILKNLGNRIKDDLLKEELDSLPKDYEEKELGRAIGKLLPTQVKNIINKL